MGNSAGGEGSVTPEAELDEFEQKILRNVREHGCHVNCVFDPDENRPAFAYSVGFPQTVGQPEVIVFGLSLRLMQSMINDTLQQCRDGLLLRDWGVVDGLLEDHKCILREVRQEYIVREYLNSAMWHHRRTTGAPLGAVMQLVWPGKINGLFPWEPGCAEEVRDAQLALYEGAIQ